MHGKNYRVEGQDVRTRVECGRFAADGLTVTPGNGNFTVARLGTGRYGLTLRDEHYKLLSAKGSISARAAVPANVVTVDVAEATALGEDGDQYVELMLLDNLGAPQDPSPVVDVFVKLTITDHIDSSAAQPAWLG